MADAIHNSGVRWDLSPTLNGKAQAGQIVLAKTLPAEVNWVK
jgi:hypothetical protein